MNARSSLRAAGAVVLCGLVYGCTIDPALPPRMFREIERTMPVCATDGECAAKLHAAKRWVLQRSAPWGLGRRIKDGHVLPGADTMVSMDEHGVRVLQWDRMPGAYFSYWIVDATIFGVEMTPASDGKQLRLRYVSYFQGRSYQRTTTDDHARTSWGETVLGFNRYVNGNHQARGPDAARRAEALKRIHRLEESPLARKADGDREWLMTWLIEDPVLKQARYCIEALGPAWQINYQYASEIETQALFSGVAFALEHPGAGTDAHGVLASGIRGALNAYQAILKKDSAAGQDGLQQLLKMDRNGELEAFLMTYSTNPDRCARDA